MSVRASAYAKALVVCPNGEMITPREKLVLIVLADSHQDKAGRFTYPSISTIAEDALCAPRSCQRYLASLERKGVIKCLRPEHQGRGMSCFYFFTALDEVPKGWQPVTLFFGERVTEGRQKGDRRVTKSRAPLMERARELEQELELSTNTPPPPQAGASVPQEPPDESLAIETAVGRMMKDCGLTAARLRKKLCVVVKQCVELGEEPVAVAAAMTRAWKMLERDSSLLFRPVRAAEFFEENLWRNPDRWPWDKQAVREARMRSEASVGTGSYLQ